MHSPHFQTETQVSNKIVHLSCAPHTNEQKSRHFVFRTNCLSPWFLNIDYFNAVGLVDRRIGGTDSSRKYRREIIAVCSECPANRKEVSWE